jgi:hypothetical protein
MNNTMRNLTLTAAALAALMVAAPKAAADDRGHGGNRGNAPRPESRSFQRREAPRPAYRGNDRHEWRERGYGGRAYVAPARPFARYGTGYGYGHAAPFRMVSVFRFYSACPGPGFVYIANTGWVFPPFFGAVWVPGHYDIEGFWVEGFWE